MRLAQPNVLVSLGDEEEAAAVKGFYHRRLGRISADGKRRWLPVTFREWESDTYLNTELTADVTLSLQDSSGKVLALNRIAAASGFWVEIFQSDRSRREKRIGGIFQDFLPLAAKTVHCPSASVRDGLKRTV